MQANPNPFQIIPKLALFPSLTKLPPVHLSPSPLPPTKQPPRAISISTPHETDHGPITNSTLDVVDDKVAAFWDYQFLFVSQRLEQTEPITLRVVEGSVPLEFPSGTYYLTGPGLFNDDHGSTVHPLDGHGYLRAFSFDGFGGDVKFMAKYVKTEAQVEEHDPLTDTWRFTHRGPFSVLKGGQKVGNTKVMKNVANTSVLRWGGKLLCLWEGGEPYEIESGTLDTVGKVGLMDGCDSVMGGGDRRGDGGGVWDVAASLLKPILYGIFKMPRKRLLSHYKLDARRNRLLMVSCNAEDMLLPCSNFTFYEYDSKFKLVEKKEFNVPDHLMIHDWGFTESHYILFANRIKLDFVGAMTAVSGATPMITALSVNPSKATSPIYLLPRSSPTENGRDWRVPIEAPSQLWLLHVANAYESLDDNGNLEIQIHASACSYEWFNFQKLFGYDWQSGKLDPSIMNINGSQSKTLPHLIQVSINMDGNGECQKCEVEALNQWTKSSDFPVINPAFSGSNNNKYIYAAASSGSRTALPHFPFDMVVKLDVSTQTVHTWSVGSRRFIGEPTFIPKGSEEEDDGYILVVEYAVSVQRCYLVILDSKKIGGDAALVARLAVPKHLNFPLGFHGFWATADR